MKNDVEIGKSTETVYLVGLSKRKLLVTNTANSSANVDL